MPDKNRLNPIPKPSGIPLLGNVLSVAADAPLQDLMRLTREQGPIFWLDMMGTPIIIVSGAELVSELCDESRFDKAVRGALRRLRAIGGDGLFTGSTQAPNWSKAHNILMPTFSQQSMRDYLPMMVDIANQLVLKWERLNSGDEIDVARDMIGLTLDTIGLCGFDYRFNSFYNDDFHPFIDALTRTLETAMNQRGLPLENIMMRKQLGQLGKDIAYMNGLVDDIIRERRQTGGDQKDLLNLMLAGKDPITGEGLSDENIRYQINTFLIAGHETTSGLLSFALYYLLKHRDVLAKAYAEVDRVLGPDISVPPTLAQIGQLEYTRAILLEALRLWPTAPAFSVYPYEDEVIGGKYHLPKGSFITILPLMLHREQSVWGEDAESFNPDHFSREAEAARPPHAYKPFGNGQRACIGRQFAMQEAILVLAMILQRFDLYDHENYDLKIKETLSLKPDGFRIRAKLREGRVKGTGVPAPASAAPEAAPVGRPKHGTALTVLYGSNLGTAEGFARRIAQDGELNGFDTALASLDSFAGKLPTSGAVIIVSASYNGAPPNNAAKFIDWLAKAEPGAATGVSYAVFGCGSRDWAATFQTIPRQIDTRLTELGASRALPRGEADAREDMDGQFHDWLETLWPKLGDTLSIGVDFDTPVQAAPLYHVEPAPSVTANPVAHQTGAIEMNVLENRELQTHEDGASDARSTRHIEIALPEGMNYQPGDHLCVVPINHPELVDRALARFGFSKDDYIRVETRGTMRSPFPNGSTFSVKRLAENYGELQAVASRKDVARLAAHTRCPKTLPTLKALGAPADHGKDAYRTDVFAKRKSVLDLLDEFPACELPFAIFLEMIPWLSPRYYSIASSPKMGADRCAITVGVIEGPARSGLGHYRGICSTHLANCQTGDTILATIQAPSSPFRLPDDPSVPVIMIGPGTGLAPFRGFLEARRALKEAGEPLGPAALFFGCRHPDKDFLYREELESAASDGLTDLYTAFSRQGPERVYVQDILRQQSDAIWPMIEAGAHIYVCGDGASMEPDVKRTLAKLHAEKRDTSFAEAEAWMEDMASAGRYVLDVWAGN